MLHELVSQDVFGLMLVFVRIGAALMLMPGFGEPYIFSRSRLLFALVLSVLLVVPLSPALPAAPSAPIDLFMMLVREAVIGLFIGAATRAMFSALHVAGMTMAVQSGLASATVFDPSQATQGSLPGNFLSTTAMVLLFVTDGHHMLLRGLASSYVSFSATGPLPLDDMAALFTQLVSEAFKLGIQISAPILLVGVLSNLAMGVLNRLMPSFQVFFIAMPLQLLLAFGTLLLSFATGLMVFFRFLDERYVAMVMGG